MAHLIILTRLRHQLAQAIADLAPPAEYLDLLRPAQDPRFGDYQANCAMPLAKALGRPPRAARQVAAEIVQRFELGDLLEPPEVAGPGFINLRLRTDWMARRLTEIARDPRLGVPPVERPLGYVLDYSAPNVAKPMHVGHIRSTIIGDCLARLLRFLGHAVQTDNHIGDWGKQFGMLIVGYKRFLDPEKFREDPVGELSRLYKLVNSKIEGDPAAGIPPDSALDEEAGQETAKLHAGDSVARTLWAQFMPFCLAELQETYDRLGIRFDHQLGESFYNPMLPAVVADLLARGIARPSAGAICVFFDQVPAAARVQALKFPCIIRKSDGGYTYATTDLATIRYRAAQFHPDAILYVVDQRQADHFTQVFTVARLWGYDAIDFRHISFGTILGPDSRPFKTREGGTVSLEALLNEAISRAHAIVDTAELTRDLPEAELRAISVPVGLGAVKYADLCQNRESDYIFDWDKMLALQGNTAAYSQYAYVRVQGIFRKGGITDRTRFRTDPPAVVLDQPQERALALALLRWPDTLHAAAVDYRPNLITDGLFAIANAFSTFYTRCPVLRAESGTLRDSRLLLGDLTARVIGQGLDLLGIQAIDLM